MSKLYLAYGSNLNIIQMGWRCPEAKVVGVGKIKDYKLTFRRVVTIEPSEKSEVMVAVWRINDNDEKALDIYERYPSLYRKEILNVEMKDKTIQAIAYIMNNGNPAMPSKSYLETIIRGYEDVGFDLSYIVEALEDTKKRI